MVMPTATRAPIPPRPAAQADPVAAATALHDRLDQAAGDAERSRDLAGETVAAVRSAGLFALALPRRLGGLEAAPETIIRTIEVLAHADAALGWTVLIGQGSGFLAWLAPDAAADIVAATPEPYIASSFAPLTVADRATGGFQLSGQWPYCSGIRHADWVMGAFLTGPAVGGPPPQRFAFVPRDAWTVRETWDAIGLVATGSNTVELRDVLVPARRTADPRTEPASEPGPLYRLPLFSLLMVCLAGFPLGVARRALDEFGALATRKSRSADRKPLADDPYVQAEVLRVEAALQASRAGVFAALGDMWAAAVDGCEVSLVLRARFAASVQQAMRTAVESVETAFRLSGGGALYRSSPLQRCWRDIQVAASHVVFGPDSVRRLGAVLLGRDVPGAMI